MSNPDRLRQTHPDVWLSQMLQRRENARHARNKVRVLSLLQKHGAEDLIPMLLDDEED
jgi:hypothetical protein